MKDSASSSRFTSPSELRWRLAILAALALAVPLLRHGPEQPRTSVAQPAAAGGWGMAGFLPGVAPITLGNRLHLPSDAQS